MKVQAVKEWFYPEIKFGGYTHVDTAIAFFSRVNSLVKPDGVVLDVGCGRGAYDDDTIPYRRDLRIMRGKAKKVIGIDVDPAGESNPHIDEFHLIDDQKWPVSERSVDLIVCDFVMEHLEEPDIFYKEAHRVLKAGGFVCVRTPNKWSYVAVIARIVPNSLHSKVVSKVQSSRKVVDVFPTHYRCNTKRAMINSMRSAGFDPSVLRHEPDPRYFSFSNVLYVFAVLVSKATPPLFRTSLFGFGRKIGS